MDRLRDRDFLGEECAFESTELRDLDRLERSTALDGDGERSNNNNRKEANKQKITNFYETNICQPHYYAH